MSSWQEYKSNAEQIQNACVFAMLTDKIIFDKWPTNKEEIDEDKLLDIRVFNEDKEAHMFRTSIDKDFFGIRVADDTQEKYADHIEEWQFLDIDTDASKDLKGEVISTGGGNYTLPEVNGVSIINDSNKPALKIVKYIKYTESGQAYVYDWRLAGIEMRGLSELTERRM